MTTKRFFGHVLAAATIALIVGGCAQNKDYSRNHRGDDPQVAQACDGKCGRPDCEQHRKQCGDCQSGRPHGGGGQPAPADCGEFSQELGSGSSDWSQKVLIRGRTKYRVLLNGKTEILGVEPLPCDPPPCPDKK